MDGSWFLFMRGFDLTVATIGKKYDSRTLVTLRPR